MKLNITQLPAAYINLEDQPIRNARTIRLLDRLGFSQVTRIEGVKVPDRYWAGLAKAVENALETMAKLPFILFEDDIRDAEFTAEIEVPEDADALFIGISSRGSVLGTDDLVPGPVLHEEVPGYPHLRRVLNMLSGHAVVYLSARYVDVVRAAAADAQRPDGKPYDLGVSYAQPNLRVYALRSPAFYQFDQTKSDAITSTNFRL